MFKRLLVACAALLSFMLASTAIAQDDNPKVLLETSMGSIEIELDMKNAPISSNNFLEYVNEGYYNELIFHRVISGFMIQGGGFDNDMQKKSTKKPIKNESYNGIKNTRGTVAMARTTAPDSATSQFYINVTDNAFLDASTSNTGYAVFGKIVKGMETVDKIRDVPTARSGMHQDVPVTPIVIKSAKLIK